MLLLCCLFALSFVVALSEYSDSDDHHHSKHQTPPARQYHNKDLCYEMLFHCSFLDFVTVASFVCVVISCWFFRVFQQQQSPQQHVMTCCKIAVFLDFVIVELFVCIFFESLRVASSLK